MFRAFPQKVLLPAVKQIRKLITPPINPLTSSDPLSISSTTKGLVSSFSKPHSANQFFSEKLLCTLNGARDKSAEQKNKTEQKVLQWLEDRWREEPRPDLINYKNELGSTLLIYAAQLGMQTLVEWLIQKNVTISRDNTGKNALDYAVENEYFGIANVLARKLSLPAVAKQVTPSTEAAKINEPDTTPENNEQRGYGCSI